MMNGFGCFRIPAWCIIQVGKVLGVKFELEGLEHVDKNKGGIVIINHQTALDLIGEFTVTVYSSSAQNKNLIKI